MKFKVFVSVMLVLIVLLQAVLTGVVIYAGLHVSRASKDLNSKVDNFNQNVTDINKNLQNINGQLQFDRQTANLP